jgi:hypothetical protein
MQAVRRRRPSIARRFVRALTWWALVIVGVGVVVKAMAREEGGVVVPVVSAAPVVVVTPKVTAPPRLAPAAKVESPKVAAVVEHDEIETTPITTPVPDVRAPDVDCTPVSASGYRKGKKTPITIVRIDGEPIERATANAFLAMHEAAAADGVELTIFSAFRSPEQQEYFYECFKTCACNSCAPAAKPGFSNHQMGKAVDIAMWPGVHTWLVANAKRFGFVATVKKEPWHWELKKGAKPPKTGVCAAK